MGNLPGGGGDKCREGFGEPLGSSRDRWEDNIKMDLTKI